ncbi:MAG: hypothetical protein R2819_14305 [Allomuricauda sp.]
MKNLEYTVLGIAMFVICGANAQGNIHVQGEGGVFTPERYALLKSDHGEQGGLGNNPAMMKLYSDMRAKFGRMGEEVNLTLDDIDGTIYLNESFVPGVLYEDGVAFKRMYLRYDAYNDEVELKETFDSDVVRSMVKHPMYSCSINEGKFLFMDYTDEEGDAAKGYLMPLVSEGNYVLYEKQIKVFKEGKPAKTSLDKGFPHRFLDKTEYYVSVNGNTPMYLKTRKPEVLSLFTEEEQKNIKQFIKDRRINVGDNTDLVNLFAYANTL